MISFYDLDPNFRAVFLGIVFTELCISIVLLQPAVKRKRLFPSLFLPFSVVSTLGLVILYGTNMKSNLLGFEEIPVSKWFCEQPVIFAFINVIAVLIILICIIIKEIQYRKNTITRSSVKESLDKLPTGLCFARMNGRVILSNNKMNHLSHNIIGMDLQNAMNFWNILSSGEVTEDIEQTIELIIKKVNLSITVNDGTNPLENVNVAIGDITGSTGSQGGCTLSNVPIGEHIITANLTDYNEYSETITVSENNKDFTISITVE